MRKKRKRFLSDRKDIPEIILFLPVLEEPQVHELVESLEKLSYPKKKRMIMVTTEREASKDYGYAGTTLAIVQDLVASRRESFPHSQIEHVHYPYRTGNKASQLNYACNKIFQEIGNDLKNTYIGVYDADSRPSPDSLLHVLHISASKPIAMQQPALFLRNFSSLSWYLQLEALFETRWVLGHEIRTLRASVDSPSSIPYAYCVGHGMFIRADFLKETGGFPEPSEDVPLGFRLGFLGIPIHPLPVFDEAEVAPSFYSLVQQSGFWFCNAALIWREYAYAKRVGLPIHKMRSLILLLKGVVDLFSWIHYLLHFVVLLLLCFQGFSFLPLSLTVVYLDSGIGIFLMLRLFPEFWQPFQCMSNGRKVLLFLCSPLRNILRGLAPFSALWHLLRARIRNDPNIFPKTKRVSQNKER